MNTRITEFLTFLNESSIEYFLEYCDVYKSEMESMMSFFFPHNITNTDKVMLFIDGENLAIRYKHEIKKRNINIPKHVFYEEDVYVWSVGLNNLCVHNVLRKYYYTSVIPEDTHTIPKYIDTLKSHHIEEPKIFKSSKDRHSKAVDISLATDMLVHATRKNYTVAVLVAGDGDYVPLVNAIKQEGCRVLLWFFEEGLSPELRRSADNFADIGRILFSPKLEHHWS